MLVSSGHHKEEIRLLQSYFVLLNPQKQNQVSKMWPLWKGCVCRMLGGVFIFFIKKAYG